MNDLQADSKRPARRPPSSRELARPGPSAQDVAWEVGLVQLLSGLEAQRALLAEQCAQGRSAAAVEAMIAAVEKTVAFAGRLDGSSPGLADLRAVADAFLAEARRLLARLRRSALGSLVRFLRGAAPEGDVHAQFVAVADRTVAVLTGFCRFFRDGFRSPDAARSWDETAGVFLADLGGLVQELRP
jgi:hypothetical protein